MVSLEAVTERSVELRFLKGQEKPDFSLGRNNNVTSHFSTLLVAITGHCRKEWINCVDSFCHESEKKYKKKL